MTANPSEPVSGPPIIARGLGLGVLGLGWWMLFSRLRVDWALNPQYGYGWFVPFLAVLLLRRRWCCRPQPEPNAAGLAFLFIAAACVLGTLPLSLILEANPEWRLAFWAMGLLNLLLSLALLGYAGGQPWLVHFAFQLAFVFVAVPWPTVWETQLIQGLMRMVAGLTVQILDLQGIPAFQQGNLIQVATGLVGVDEACSGVRSLQTSLFVALYLGEHHRLRGASRGLLLVAGLGIAIAANTLRTWFLTWLAARWGLAVMNDWHDPAGLVVTCMTLVGLWLLVWRTPAPPAQQEAPRALERPVPTKLAAVFLSTLALAPLLTEGWYRAHERDVTAHEGWSIDFPEKSPGFRQVQISEKATAMLRQTEGRAAEWTDAFGYRWQVFFLRWAPGSNSAQLAKGHRPEICLPGTGFRLVEQLPERELQIGGQVLPVRQYVFELERQLLHVFYVNWEDRVLPADRALDDIGTQASRLKAVQLGRRNLGQRVLEVMIRGPEGVGEASEVLATGLAPLLRWDPAASARQR